jgi:alkaline phosphatase D
MKRITIFLSLIAVLISCQSSKETSAGKKFKEAVSSLYDPSMAPFYHGVASGDPMSDRVILWTRVTPTDSAAVVSVDWELSEEEKFDPVLKKGTLTTSAERDYTIKIDVSGLSPGKYYFYRFMALGRSSVTGRTKTLSDNDDSLRFAIVSCSNWEFGYFNAYNGIAEKELDAIIHLGDYIYEYGVGQYGNKNVDRKHLPDHETVTLSDYRTRYSQYHLDAALRRARQKHPFITIWDDHEVANDVYKDGAGNHQADQEGDFQLRKAAAQRAYYEWLPIREGGKLYRSFSFGKLASLIMLDERLEGRTKQLETVADPALNDPQRSMLGSEQLAWFQEALKTSAATWKIIGNQVIFSDLDQSSASAKRPRNLDSWDGYPAEKKKIADFIRKTNIQDVIFLAGDTHSSWAFEVVVDPDKRQDAFSTPFAIELGTTSISSSNSNERTSDDTVKMKEAMLLKGNPHLKYTNHRDHGYLLLSLYPQRATAEWYYVDTLLKPDDRESLGKKVEIQKGKAMLE